MGSIWHDRCISSEDEKFAGRVNHANLPANFACNQALEQYCII